MHGGVLENPGAADPGVDLDFHEVGAEALANLAVGAGYGRRRADEDIAAGARMMPDSPAVLAPKGP